MGAVITSIADLRRFASGAIVELPPFAEGTTFFARLRRPSMLGMISEGRIPNELLGIADKLFVGSAGDGKEVGRDNLSQMMSLLKVFAEECFVEPRYTELEEAGIRLTDEQLMFVFNYAQAGVRALGNFRPESKSTGDNKYGEDVPEDSSGDPEYL